MEILVSKMDSNNITLDKGVGYINGMHGDINFHVKDDGQTDELYKSFLAGKVPNSLILKHETNTIPPLLPIKLSNRTLLVENFILKLNKSALLHIQGEIGTGKTQLCNLIIKKIDANIYWFRTKEYKEQLKTFIIELGKLIQDSQGINLLKMFSKDLRIEASSVVVLDDLPNITELRIEEDFIRFVTICEENNIKIISTSNYVLPDRLNQYIRYIESVKIPTLTEDDTIEILSSYEAPEEIKKYAKLINIFSDSHPSLVIATINFLKLSDWKIDIDNFLNNKFIENELQNSQNFLDKTVQDTQTKELVYRLNNIGRTVTDEEIQLVSNIEPKIQHPFIKLGTLLDAWIFKESDKEYLLSPLIYKIGSKNLDLEVEKNINFALGNYVFQKGTVNPYEISKGINYYVKAQEYNIAGLRLFQALHSAMEIDTISEDDMFYLHSYWVGVDLPIKMRTGTQLLLRTAQIIFYNKFGNDTEELHEDYLKLEEKIPPSGVHSYPLLISYMLFSQNNYQSFKYGLKLNDKMNSYSNDERKKIGIPIELEGVPVDAIFILDLHKLTSLNEFSLWILAIKKMDIGKLKQLFDSDIGRESIQPIQHAINKQLILAKEVDDIQEIYKLLMDMSDYMYSHAVINGWASLIASAVDCLIEEGKFNEAKELVEYSVKRTDDEDCKLIINHQLSMKYVDKKDYDNAIILYTEVLSIENTLIKDTLVDALTYASIAFGSIKEYNKAKIYIEKAIDLYKSLNNHDDLLLSKLYGEYSIVLWHMDLHHECLLVSEEVLIFIEKNMHKMDNSIKAIEVILGHNIGYYFSILTTGVSPKKLDDGDDYFIPHNGTFIYTGKEQYTLYDQDKVFLLYYQFYNSFYQLNDRDKGVIYLHKSFELSKKSSLENFKILLYKDIHLVENNFIEYFKFIKSIEGKVEQETVAILLYLSLLKLITELLNSKNKIEEFKTAFISMFSKVLKGKYFDTFLYTLLNFRT